MSDHLALIIEGLCQAVARRVGLGGIAGPLIILIWTRLRRIAARFTRTIAAPPPSCPEPVITARRRAPSPRQPRPHLLPRRKAWLLRLAPETASGASQLRHFLADPEVAALLANNPELFRILRPLCQMLGIRAAGIHPAKAAPPPDMAPAEAPPAPIPCLASRQSAPAMAPPVAHPPWSASPPPPESVTALA